MENEFDEESFKDEVLKAAQEYLQHTTTIDEAIDGRKKQIAAAKESFEIIWEAYNTVSKSRNKEEYIFRKARMRIYLYGILVNLLSAFNRRGAYEEVMNLHSDISQSIKDLREERELLLNIKKAIKELQKYEAIDCNYDISLLLSLINDKNSLMYEVLNESIQSLNVRLRGISFSSTNKAEQLELINENIDYKVQELKLLKNPNN